MRFVGANNLREGMILARTLYRKSDVMLAQGIALTQQYITSIQRCGFAGAYIDDELSADIEIEPLISDRLRLETVRQLERIQKFAEMDDGTHRHRMPDLSSQIEDIVFELSRNKDVMVNMTNLSDYDSYTYTHSVNVCMLSVLLGISLGLSRAELVGLGTGALLHDIGKIYVSKQILLKNGPLTDEEFDTIKKHPKDGYDYIARQFHFPTKYMFTILDHHEKFNGAGYPNHKQGEDISLYGRICAVADVYDALNSKRPYRDSIPVHECVEYLMGAAAAQFDPEMVQAFIRRIAPYPLGTSVKLSNGWVGLVLVNYAEYSLRPRLRIYQKFGQYVTPFEISLKDDPRYLNVTITGVT